MSDRADIHSGLPDVANSDGFEYGKYVRWRTLNWGLTVISEALAAPLAPPSILVARRGLNGGWSWDPPRAPHRGAGLIGGLDSRANAGRALLLANPPQTAHRSYPTGPERRTFWATPGVRRWRTLHHELADASVSFRP
jgi:hypothetical protein